MHVQKKGAKLRLHYAMCHSLHACADKSAKTIYSIIIFSCFDEVMRHCLLLLILSPLTPQENNIKDRFSLAVL